MSVITIADILDNWTTEPYLNLLIYQCEATRFIIESIDNKHQNGKPIIETYVIGLLTILNNQLLNRYSITEYRLGIAAMCASYNNFIISEKFLIKSSWMTAVNRNRFC